MIRSFLLGPGVHVTDLGHTSSSLICSHQHPKLQQNDSFIRNYINRINLLGQTETAYFTPSTHTETCLLKQNYPRAQCYLLETSQSSVLHVMGPADLTIFYPPLNLQIYLCLHHWFFLSYGTVEVMPLEL